MKENMPLTFLLERKIGPGHFLLRSWKISKSTPTNFATSWRKSVLSSSGCDALRQEYMLQTFPLPISRIYWVVCVKICNLFDTTLCLGSVSLIICGGRSRVQLGYVSDETVTTRYEKLSTWYEHRHTGEDHSKGHSRLKSFSDILSSSNLDRAR